FLMDPATSYVYTLSLHDALPILRAGSRGEGDGHRRDRLRSSGRENVRAPQVLGGAPRDARARVLPSRESLQPARDPAAFPFVHRSEEHTSELQSRSDLVCRLLLE